MQIRPWPTKRLFWSSRRRRRRRRRPMRENCGKKAKVCFSPPPKSSRLFVRVGLVNFWFGHHQILIERSMRADQRAREACNLRPARKFSSSSLCPCIHIAVSSFARSLDDRCKIAHAQPLPRTHTRDSSERANELAKTGLPKIDDRQFVYFSHTLNSLALSKRQTDKLFHLLFLLLYSLFTNSARSLL